MNPTLIEWVKNPDGTQGMTWNPITGCLNSCEYCYARKLANGRLKSRYLANRNIAIDGIKFYQREGEVSQNTVTRAYNDPFYPRFWEDRLFDPVNKIRRWGRQSKVVHRQEPKGIFVCDMSDLFGIGIPEEWTQRVIDRFQYAPQHRFYLLTKQPQNLVRFSPFPDNCWVGVTATTNGDMTKALIGLSQIEAKLKYISVEPHLGQIGMRDHMSLKDAGIGWLIDGAQTKPYKPPQIEWVEEIVRACDKAGVKVFLKDNLKPMFGKMTSNEVIRYGDLSRPCMIQKIAFTEDEDNMLVAHTLRQEMPQ